MDSHSANSAAGMSIEDAFADSSSLFSASSASSATAFPVEIIGGNGHNPYSNGNFTHHGAVGQGKYNGNNGGNFYGNGTNAGRPKYNRAGLTESGRSRSEESGFLQQQQRHAYYQNGQQSHSYGQSQQQQYSNGNGNANGNGFNNDNFSAASKDSAGSLRSHRHVREGRQRSFPNMPVIVPDEGNSSSFPKPDSFVAQDDVAGLGNWESVLFDSAQQESDLPRSTTFDASTLPRVSSSNQQQRHQDISSKQENGSAQFQPPVFLPQQWDSASWVSEPLYSMPHAQLHSLGSGNFRDSLVEYAQQLLAQTRNLEQALAQKDHALGQKNLVIAQKETKIRQLEAQLQRQSLQNGSVAPENSSRDCYGSWSGEKAVPRQLGRPRKAISEANLPVSDSSSPQSGTTPPVTGDSTGSEDGHSSPPAQTGRPRRNSRRGSRPGHKDEDLEGFQICDMLGNDVIESFPADVAQLFRTSPLHSVARSQGGAKALCEILDRAETSGEEKSREIVIAALLPKLDEFICDAFGQAVFGKLVSVADEATLAIAVGKVVELLPGAAHELHGTQSLMHLVGAVRGENLDALLQGLEPHFTELMLHNKGNYLIQFLFDNLPAETCSPSICAAADRIVEIACDRVGCVVLKRAIDLAGPIETQRLAEAIGAHALELVQDPFGNYVFQHFLEQHKNDDLAQSLICVLSGHLTDLCVQKFSSNVVERALKIAQGRVRQACIEEITHSDCLASLLRDKFANFVVQTALDVAPRDQRVELIRCIQPHLANYSPYTGRLQKKIARYL